MAKTKSKVKEVVGGVERPDVAGAVNALVKLTDARKGYLDEFVVDPKNVCLECANMRLNHREQTVICEASPISTHPVTGETMYKHCIEVNPKGECDKFECIYGDDTDDEGEIGAGPVIPEAKPSFWQRIFGA